MKVKEPKKLRGRNPSITKKGALSTDRFPHVYIFNINMKDLSKRSWGKRVGGSDESWAITLRRDAEPYGEKSLIPCCREKSSSELARRPYPKPTQVRW
jgi:hypothetical protein